MSGSEDAPATGGTLAPPVLAGRVMVLDGPEHPCRVGLGDLDAVPVATAAPGRRDGDAVCYLDAFGALRGRIGAVTDDGFTLHPTMNAEQRGRLAVRLAWHAARAAWTAEQRAAPRIVPDHRDVAVRLPDARILRGLILDLSKGGAKISLPSAAPVAVGAPVTVGKRYATIVRVEEGAIAVRFRLPFCDETFNPGVIL